MGDNSTARIERTDVELDEERTRNYALRLVAMVEDGVVDDRKFADVLREHAAGSLGV